MIFNIKLPVEFDDYFIPPELEKNLDFYPKFLEQYGKPLSFQAYMSMLLKEMDEKKPNGFNGQQAFDAFIRYNGGLEWFTEKYKDFIFLNLDKFRPKNEDKNADTEKMRKKENA